MNKAWTLRKYHVLFVLHPEQSRLYEREATACQQDTTMHLVVLKSVRNANRVVDWQHLTLGDIACLTIWAPCRSSIQAGWHVIVALARKHIIFVS